MTGCKSISGKCAAGCSRARERHGLDTERVQSPWPFGPERLRPDQWHTAGQAAEGRQDSRGIQHCPHLLTSKEKEMKINMRKTSNLETAHWPLTHIQSWLDSGYIHCFYSGTVLPDSRKPLTMWWTTSERVPRRLRPQCSSPCLCALLRPTRWGHQAIFVIFLYLCPDRVNLSFLVRWEVPWFQTWMLSVSVREKQGRALAASVPQDVAYSPRPNNRKGQLGLTPGLQLWCLDWSPLPSSLIPFTPGQPRPAPPHCTLPEIVLSMDLWDLLKEMCNTRISVCVCLSECVWVT